MSSELIDGADLNILVVKSFTNLLFKTSKWLLFVKKYLIGAPAVLTFFAVVWHDDTSSRFVPIEKAMYKMCRQICGAMDKTKRSTSITEAGLIPIRIRVETVARTHLAKKNAKTKDMLTIEQFHRGTVP